MTFIIKQNDTRPFLTEICFDGLKRYFDPTTLGGSVSIKFNMNRVNPTPLLNMVDHGAAYIADAVVSAARAATWAAQGYTLADGTTPFAAGAYKALEYRWETVNATAQSSADDGMEYEFETDDGTGSPHGILTFPNGSNNKLTVKPQVK